jgi:Zn-dependent protease
MNNIRVGSLFGIPFYVNPSWFLVLGLVTLSYGSGLAAQFPTLPPGMAWGLGLLTALLLFSSVLAHELGHSFVALRQGIGVIVKAAAGGHCWVKPIVKADIG